MQKTDIFFSGEQRDTEENLFLWAEAEKKKEKEKDGRKEKNKNKNAKHRPAMVLSHTDPNLEGSRPWQLAWPCARLGGQARLHPGQ